MIDRLPDLQRASNLMKESMSNEQLELQTYEQPEKAEQGIDDEFIEQLKSIREILGALRSNNQRIQTLKGSYAKAIKPATEKQNSQEMNKILVQNTKYHRLIKEKLGVLKQSVDKAQEQNPDEPETTMKKNFYYNVNKQVSEVLEKQQGFEEEYKNTVKDKVVRQVRLIDKDIDEEQMQEYVNNPDLAQKMLQKKMFGQASISLKNTVCDIQDKFRDIITLEKSVNQCVLLFNELSALVYAQGEHIDNIEANVRECKNYVEKAQKKLEKGKQHHKCSKKCLCIGIVAGLIVLIIIIVAVVATK